MRWRLLLAFGLVILICLAAVAVFMRLGATSEVESLIGRGGLYGLEGHIKALEDYYQENGGWEGADELLSQSMIGSGQGQGGIMRPGRGAGNQNPNAPLRPVPSLALADADGNLVYDNIGFSSAPSEGDLQNAFLLRDGDQVVGYLFASNGALPPPAVAEEILVNRLLGASLRAAALAGLVAVVLALVLAYALLRPVQQLTKAATRMAAGDLSQRVPANKEVGEFKTLSATFNSMAESLEQAQHRRRALTADIAHELRNPLAVQRAHLEALQDGVYPLNNDTLAPIAEQNQLLTRLVEDLRTLGLADAGELVLDKSPTDLPKLVQRVADSFQPDADHKSVSIHCQLPSSCPPVLADSQRLEQVLVNLLNNALRFTPQDGSIEMALRCDQHQASLSVHDSGPGIPPDSLPYLFERFYRGDRSRSRDQGGTGLGLAIARKLAQAHGGSLEAANHPNGGALFTLQLPLMREEIHDD